MQMTPSDAVLGFRPHTYWTAAVALGGTRQAPVVLERSRIVFADEAERFVFHQAAEIPEEQAERLIERVRTATEASAAREIDALVTALRSAGISARTAVVPAGTARLPPRLADILRVHARIHAAEGNFYRDVVASACTQRGLDVLRVVERDLPSLVCGHLGIDASALEHRLREMGAAAGKPWNEDYRLAAQAAWAHI